MAFARLILVGALATGMCVNAATSRGQNMSTDTGEMAVPTAPTNGLILYYSFDRNEADRVSDRSGWKNHGTIHLAKWIALGDSGGAYDFNGADTYVHVPYDVQRGLFPTSGCLSVAAWFRTSETQLPEQVIVATHMAGAGSGYMLSVDEVGSAGKGRLRWLIMDGTPNGNRVWSAKPVNDGAWHHALAVWDGRQTRLYLDGLRQDARDAAATISYPQQAGFRVGHTENINTQGAFDRIYYFRGQIDDVRVYNRGLDDSQAMTLFSCSPHPDLAAGEEKVILELVNRLAADDPKTRREARQKLKAMGQKAFPVLMRYRQHTDAEIRAAIREILGP